MNKKLLKKIILGLKLIFLSVFILFLVTFIYYKRKISKYEKEINSSNINAYVNELLIYSTNLRLEGTVDAKNIKEVYLSFVDKFGYEVPYLINFSNNENDISFYTGTKINDQFNMEQLNIENDYKLYLKTIDINNNISYHNLINETNYLKTTYYTIYHNDINYKIDIYTNYKLEVSVKKNTDIVYDIVLDADHGGIDSGACYNKTKTCERIYTKKIVNDIKTLLEKKGVKVALSWNVDNIKDNEYIKTYGESSRISNIYESYAKYTLSLHLNSSNTTKLKGFELYTPYNVDYTFARNLRNNIKNNTTISYSNNTFNKVENSIYTRTFTSNEIIASNNERTESNSELYTITTKTNYYFMIRETGGYMSGSYVTSPNSKGETNEYATSNRGTESYILELAYINRYDEIKNFEKNYNNYVKAISNSILQ